MENNRIWTGTLEEPIFFDPQTHKIYHPNPSTDSKPPTTLMDVNISPLYQDSETSQYFNIESRTFYQTEADDASNTRLNKFLNFLGTKFYEKELISYDPKTTFYYSSITESFLLDFDNPIFYFDLETQTYYHPCGGYKDRVTLRKMVIGKPKEYYDTNGVWYQSTDILVEDRKVPKRSQRIWFSESKEIIGKIKDDRVINLEAGSKTRVPLETTSIHTLKPTNPVIYFDSKNYIYPRSVLNIEGTFEIVKGNPIRFSDPELGVFLSDTEQFYRIQNVNDLDSVRERVNQRQDTWVFDPKKQLLFIPVGYQKTGVPYVEIRTGYMGFDVLNQTYVDLFDGIRYKSKYIDLDLKPMETASKIGRNRSFQEEALLTEELVDSMGVDLSKSSISSGGFIGNSTVLSEVLIESQKLSSMTMNTEDLCLAETKEHNLTTRHSFSQIGNLWSETKSSCVTINTEELRHPDKILPTADLDVILDPKKNESLETIMPLDEAKEICQVLPEKHLCPKIIVENYQTAVIPESEFEVQFQKTGRKKVKIDGNPKENGEDVDIQWGVNVPDFVPPSPKSNRRTRPMYYRIKQENVKFGTHIVRKRPPYADPVNILTDTLTPHGIYTAASIVQSMVKKGKF